MEVSCCLAARAAGPVRYLFANSVERRHRRGAAESRDQDSDKLTRRNLAAGWLVGMTQPVLHGADASGSPSSIRLSGSSTNGSSMRPLPSNLPGQASADLPTARLRYRRSGIAFVDSIHSASEAGSTNCSSGTETFCRRHATLPPTSPIARTSQGRAIRLSAHGNDNTSNNCRLAEGIARNTASTSN